MEELTLSDFFAILRRWRKIFTIVFLALAALTLILAESWSNYRSIAVVQVEQPEIAPGATTFGGGNTRDMNEALADQRISAIEQKVTSTASLIDIITKFGLYPEARQRKPIAQIAEAMRKKIRVELISSALANPAAANRISANDLSAIAFKLSFDYNAALLTQQVTDELTTRFLDEDLKERRTQAEETANFLAKQITVMEGSLSDQEKHIADYQQAHGISRPGNLAFNQQAAATLTMNIGSLDGQITANEGTLGALRAQLASLDPYARVIADGQVVTSPSIQLKALQARYATLSAQYGPDHPDVIKIRHQIEALQSETGIASFDLGPVKAQIADVRTHLAAARKTYGPEHPDVIALQNRLQKLEDRLATHRSSLPGSRIVPDADNPAYLQAASQLRAAEEQSKALLSQRRDLTEQQQSYQKAIADNPEVEKEMAALARDYENAQIRYRELKEKKLTADMEVDMQTSRKGQRLTLIDPPEYPINTQPMRLVLMLGGLAASLFGGLVAVAIAQTLGRSVIGPHHVETITGATPLVSIPHILTRDERSRAWSHRGLTLWGQTLRQFHHAYNTLDGKVGGFPWKN